MYLKVQGKDINNIGYKVFDNEGYLTIVSEGSCYGLEDILLRNILRCFGEDYTMTDSYDYERPDEPGDSEEMDVAWDTNLPWEIYCNEKDTNEVMVDVLVNKSDISRIGHTAFDNEDGMATIIADGDTCLLEAILFRSILKCFGEQYHIANEYYEPKDIEGAALWDTDLTIESNLPMEIFWNESQQKEGFRKVDIEKADIERVGYLKYDASRKYVVECHKKTSPIERIFLSNILKCWGEEHCIEKVKELAADEVTNENTSVRFYTSLPFEQTQNETKNNIAPERGILNIVVEGEDAQVFHNGLMDFISKSKNIPEYIINDRCGGVYWKIGAGEEHFKEGKTLCVDCYNYSGAPIGSVAIIWDSYEKRDGLVRLSAVWLKDIVVSMLGYIWVKNPNNYFFEFNSLKWGIVTNDAESRYFDKRIEVIEYDLENVPDDWDKDWDNLSFDERIALCEKCDVIYLATRVITASDE